MVGLTATPIRRDGQQPIIFMQCGLDRLGGTRRAGRRTIWRSRRSSSSRRSLCAARRASRMCSGIWHKTRPARQPSPCDHPRRLPAGRKVLALTERKHIDAIRAALWRVRVPQPLVVRPNVKEGSARADHCARCLVAGRATVAGHRHADRRRLQNLPGTPWCWRCRSRGRARCSNTPVACTGLRQQDRRAHPSISSTRGIRPCCGCGTNASAAIGRWGIASIRVRRP